MKARCGDALVQQGVEECDDANDDDTDECPTSCNKATCGDGFVWNDREECDDGKSAPGDGCDASCNVEPILVSVGGSHSCAVLGDYRLKCWGDNTYTQVLDSTDLAVGDNASELGESLNARLTEVSLVAVGDRHTCAIQVGQVKCWGDNRDKQLGPRATADVSAKEVLVDPRVDSNATAEVTSICAGDSWTAVLMKDGTVNTWGVTEANPTGALLQVPFSPEVAAIECSGNALCARLEGRFEAECWGYWRDQPDEPLRVIDAGLDKIPVDISVGYSKSCLVSSSGMVRCWGSGWSGALMIDPEVQNPFWVSPNDKTSWAPSLVGDGARSLSSGGDITCVIYADGSVRCWGADVSGVLGQPALTASGNNLGDSQDELTDGAIPAIDLGSGLEVKALSTSGAHTCALFANGRVKCWGNNEQGQLAIGTSDAAIGDDVGEMGDVLRYASID